jgi:hypothetical protein
VATRVSIGSVAHSIAPSRLSNGIAMTRDDMYISIQFYLYTDNASFYSSFYKAVNGKAKTNDLDQHHEWRGTDGSSSCLVIIPNHLGRAKRACLKHDQFHPAPARHDMVACRPCWHETCFGPCWGLGAGPLCQA